MNPQWTIAFDGDIGLFEAFPSYSTAAQVADDYARRYPGHTYEVVLDPDTFDLSDEKWEYVDDVVVAGASVILASTNAVTNRDLEHTLTAERLKLVAKAPQMLALLKEAYEALREAVEVHVYGDDETPDPDCRYHALLREIEDAFG